MKESVFNNYQEINHLFSINFRKLVAEDCELISDSGFFIDENNLKKGENTEKAALLKLWNFNTESGEPLVFREF